MFEAAVSRINHALDVMERRRTYSMDASMVAVGQAKQRQYGWLS